MKLRNAFVCALLLLLAAQTSAFAEGFGVYEWSASGTAMGEAYMFGENDPAVLAYNPAQITKLDGKYLSFGNTWVNYDISTRFTGSGMLNGYKDGVWDSEYSPANIPYFYYAQKAGKNSWWGVAFFARYGNNIEYDDAWPGRYDTVYSGIKGVTLQPTYAFKINDKLSMGVGLDINYINLRMKKDTPAYANPSKLNPALPNQNIYLGDIHSDLNGHTTELGWVASLMYDFTPKTSVAVMYRAKVEHTMDADIDFDYALSQQAQGILGSLPATVRQALAAKMPGYTGAHGKVTLPDSISIGIGHKFDDRTRIEFDAVWTNWATYDALNTYFDNGPLGTPGTFQQKNWKASWRLGLGIEHKLSRQWSIMGGYVWDQSPVPNDSMDFTVPTGDRHRGSLGFKYRPTENSEIAFAYTAIWAGSRDVKSHLSRETGAFQEDYVNGHLHDGLTQLVSLGYTMKLK